MSISLSLVLYILLCSLAAAAAARLTNVVLNNELIYSNERGEEEKFNCTLLSLSLSRWLTFDWSAVVGTTNLLSSRLIRSVHSRPFLFSFDSDEGVTKSDGQT